MEKGELRLRCLELAAREQTKIGDRHIKSILATADILWQYVSEQPSPDVSPPATGGEGQSKRGRKPKTTGEPDLLS